MAALPTEVGARASKHFLAGDTDPTSVAAAETSTTDSQVRPFHEVEPHQPRVEDLVDATLDSIRPAKGVVVPRRSDTDYTAEQTSTQRFSTIRAMSRRFLRTIGAGDTRVRRVSTIKMLEDDIVAQNYRHLPPIQLIETAEELVDKPPPGDTHPVWATLGLILLYIALTVASAPLVITSVDAESLTDNSGLLVKKNASYAKAYFLGNGFYSEFVKTMKNNNTAINWFPQPTDTKFLNYSYMNASTYASYGSGACALLNPDPKNPIECIMMTGHQGSVSTYGLCRNGSEFIALHYITGLVTPADVGGLVSSGMWIENTREVILTGLKSPPTCVDGKKVVVEPKLDDWRILSGPFNPATRGAVNQWMDTMVLPGPVRQRMFYLNGKVGGRLGITLPTSKRQSFDEIIAQNTYGSTLAEKLEIQAPFGDSKYLFITLYRMAGATIKLPRLNFTFAVAAQLLWLLIFMLALTVRNGPVRSYNLVVQILRLPTFCIISIQLLYVLYYQIFSLAYLATNPTLHESFAHKVVYVAGVSFILMHQVDVRAAVTLWPRMANNDSYYVVRLAWMLGSLSVVMWSLNQSNPGHYVVATKPNCPLGAVECNTTSVFFTQHWAYVGILVGHPIAYGAIQIMQWYRNRSEYSPRDQRHPDYLTSFEAYGCGGPLTDYYYYHTLVTKAIASAKQEGSQRSSHTRSLQYLTCSKAVRDEGFVLLGGCHALVRAKDVYVFVIMKFIPRKVASNINLSVVIAHIVDSRLTPMRRVSYEALWSVARRWDGGVSYPDIG